MSAQQRGDRAVLVAQLSIGAAEVRASAPMTLEALDELIEYLAVYRASLAKREPPTPSPKGGEP